MKWYISSDRRHMDWSGLTSPRLRWYDWNFFLVSSGMVLAGIEHLVAIFVSNGWDQGWQVLQVYYSPDGLGFWVNLISFTVPIIGLVAYFTRPQSIFRPTGRTFCSLTLFPVILLFCFVAMDIIEVTKSTYDPHLGRELQLDGGGHCG